MRDMRVGTNLGAYRLLDVLALGSKTTVYRAVDEADDRPVVVRVLHRELSGNDAARAALLREAWTSARIPHPVRVATREVGHGEGGALYLVSEHVAGESLEEVLRSRGPLDLESALAIARDVLDVVTHAHVRGFVHGVVTPAKVLVTRDGPRLLDCDAYPRTASPTTRAIPDRLDHETRADVESCAILLCSMLSGKPAHAMAPPRAEAERIAREACARTSDVTDAVAEVLLAGLGWLRPVGSARELAQLIVGVEDLLVVRRALLSTLPQEASSIPPISGVFAHVTVDIPKNRSLG